MHKRNDNFNPKDEMRTPPSLFKKLNDRFQFTVDIAANVDNKLIMAELRKPAAPITSRTIQELIQNESGI